jgi:hypothetical protein
LSSSNLRSKQEVGKFFQERYGAATITHRLAKIPESLSTPSVSCVKSFDPI